jgi:hypothetical protein
MVVTNEKPSVSKLSGAVQYGRIVKSEVIMPGRIRCQS